MQYIWLATFDGNVFARAFSSEYEAVNFIEKEKILNPQNAKYLDWHKVPAEIDLRDY